MARFWEFKGGRCSIWGLRDGKRSLSRARLGSDDFCQRLELIFLVQSIHCARQHSCRAITRSAP